MVITKFPVLENSTRFPHKTTEILVGVFISHAKHVSLVFSFKDDLHLMNNWRVGPVNNTLRIHIIAYPNVLGPGPSQGESS